MQRSAAWIDWVQKGVERAETTAHPDATRFRELWKTFGVRSESDELSVLEDELTSAGFLPFRWSVYRRPSMAADPDISIGSWPTFEAAKHQASRDTSEFASVYFIRDLVTGRTVYSSIAGELQ
jgi:hypothetical protein